jgi:hypothetical protein
MAMAGLGGGDPATIWRWPLTYYLLVRREFLKASNIQVAGMKGAVPGETVTSREVRGSVTVERYTKD